MTVNVKELVNKAIEIVGGAKELASLLGVSYKSVLDWKNGRTKVTPTNCIKIEKVTEGKIKREQFLPDYPWEELK